MAEGPAETAEVPADTADEVPAETADEGPADMAQSPADTVEGPANMADEGRSDTSGSHDVAAETDMRATSSVVENCDERDPVRESLSDIDTVRESLSDIDTVIGHCDVSVTAGCPVTQQHCPASVVDTCDNKHVSECDDQTLAADRDAELLHSALAAAGPTDDPTARNVDEPQVPNDAHHEPAVDVEAGDDVQVEEPVGNMIPAPLAVLAPQGLGDVHQAMMQAGGPVGFQPYNQPNFFALRVICLISVLL